MVSTVLDLQDVRRRRGQGDGPIFELIVPCLRIERGRFVAVIGPSGCGKSTLLDMLALVLQPSECGSFTFFRSLPHGGAEAVDVKRLWAEANEAGLARLRRSHLGYVLQTGGLLPFLSVRANIELPFRLNRLGPAHEVVRELAGRIGILSELGKKPQHLSGGQRQRAAILRAIAYGPELILADEPTAAVDKQRAIEIVCQFSALARERGTTVAMVTHDVSLVRDVADVTMTFHTEAESDTYTRSVCYEAA